MMDSRRYGEMTISEKQLGVLRSIAKKNGIELTRKAKGIFPGLPFFMASMTDGGYNDEDAADRISKMDNAAHDAINAHFAGDQEIAAACLGTLLELIEGM